MLGSLFFSRSALFIRPMFMSRCFGQARSTCSAELLTARCLEPGFAWRSCPARNPKEAIKCLFRPRNRARDFVNAGASSIWAKMDLARRFDRISHRASKHHLANRTQLAHLGFVARYRAEPQERRPHAVGIFLAANYPDESGNVSAVVRRIDLAA